MSRRLNIFTGVIFVLMGTMLLWQFGSLTLEAMRFRNAVVVRATLLDVYTYLSTTGRHGPYRQIYARYSYPLDGRTYTSTDLTIFKPALDLYPQLKNAFDTHRQVDGYVDRSDPSRSVLDRTVPGWEFVGRLVFALLVAGIGLLSFNLARRPNRTDIEALPASKITHFIS